MTKIYIIGHIPETINHIIPFFYNRWMRHH